MQASGEVMVMDHSAWPKKDRNGKPVEGHDCQVTLAIGYGQPAVKCYVTEEKARELAESTGQSFNKQGRPRFQPYRANAELEIYARSSTTEGSKYVNTNLAVALRQVEPVEAAAGRRSRAAA